MPSDVLQSYAESSRWNPYENIEVDALWVDPSASIEDWFECYENGKIKTYSYFSKNRLNSYCFDEKENLILSSI